MVKPEEIQSAYEAVKKATAATFEAGLKFTAAKDALDRDILQATADGLIEGKNETERKAAAYTRFDQNYHQVDQLEKTYKVETNNLALARIHLDCLRDLLRMAEVAVAERLAYPLQSVLVKGTKEKIKGQPPK